MFSQASRATAFHLEIEKFAVVFHSMRQCKGVHGEGLAWSPQLLDEAVMDKVLSSSRVIVVPI